MCPLCLAISLIQYPISVDNEYNMWVLHYVTFNISLSLYISLTIIFTLVVDKEEY
jgi:ABC-type long-subunit fatty acid transport system fused permease/ATPase subunit